MSALTVLELYGAKINENHLNLLKKDKREIIIKQIEAAHKISDMIALVQSKEFVVIHHNKYRMDAIMISNEIIASMRKM